MTAALNLRQVMIDYLKTNFYIGDGGEADSLDHEQLYQGYPGDQADEIDMMNKRQRASRLKKQKDSTCPQQLKISNYREL